MDSITHLALGACMGEAFAGKKLGKKAMVWGALAQSAPDIDFLAAFWMDTASNLLAHRGFTHSILFCALITPLLALLAERWHRPHNITLWRWMLFFGGVIFAHIFFDAFNNYGVGWFEPFSHHRVTFHILYVADPFFSFAPGIAALILWIKKSRRDDRKIWWMLGLGISGIYLLYATFNKFQINRDVRETLERQDISYTRCFTTPAPGQTWLWYVVAGDDQGYHIGYRSLFDEKENIEFTYFPRNDTLLTQLIDHESLHKLIRFSQEFYTLERWDDRLIFNDLRFGQVMGWENPKGQFVFYYFLEEPHENLLVVQRGRFSGWNKEAMSGLWKRIKGE